MIVILLLVSSCQPTVETSTPLSRLETSTAVVQTTTTDSENSKTPLPAAIPDSTVDPAAMQLNLLYQASLKYLAETDAQSWQVAKELQYAPLGGYPSNMCGPLAVSILKDAGILGSAVDLHDFWLLDPLVDDALLKTVFPSDAFEWLHTDQSIHKIDFTQFPLKAGDLVYIYSGALGDYSHVLTVTRVDEFGRAYSVTNNYTTEGFVIQEYLLYDPAQEGEGIFYDWTDPANLQLGLTGFGGMEVWRPISLPHYSDRTP
ncbi:hypothetical protein ACFLXB_05970 [Chloroflexota bacterium]